MVKALGKDIKSFWNTDNETIEFLKDYSHDMDYDQIDFDFEDIIDTEKYELEKLGWFNHDFDDSKKSISFKTAFQKWKKEQTIEVLLVSFPKSKSIEIRDQLKLIEDLKWD